MKLKTLIYPIKVISKIISIIVNSILLSLVYFIGIGITSIIAKLMKKKFLSYKTNSSWEDFKISNKKEDYKRMF